ncbi:ABC transporter substrate-binding protein [Orrella sp. JC864]|uniref:ABC transporter substrate-binding protein n=1 Tax=Orrella sp. JC864 TaxID=3120298 RepID=UPI00300A576C
MSMPALRRVAAAALLAAAHVAAPAWASAKDDTLVVAFQREVVNLDYLYTTSQEHIILSDLTDDRLFDVDPHTNEIRPMLATGYAYVDDRTIDVTLREGVRFHSGAPFTADDVVYTYQWVLDAESGTRASGALSRWLDRVEKTGPMQVRFHLKAVYPLALRDMARRIPIRRNGAYEAGGKPDRGAQALKPDGLGPYRVESFEPGQRAVLQRFEDYYADSPKGRPAIGRIVARTLPDWGTQQAELMSGGVNWAYDMPLDVAQSMAATGRIRHTAGPSLRMSFVVLDAAGVSGPSVLNDLRVRRAVNHAINREAISKFLVGGVSQALHTACHPAQFGCDQDVMAYPYDPERARALLKEAGYKGQPIDLWAYRERSVAEAVAADLTAAGLRVNLRYGQLASLDQARAAGRIQAYIGSWANGGTADTAMIARVHFADTDRNMARDAQVEDLVMRAERTNDPQARAQAYSQALGIIAEQAYWAPLFTYSVNYLTSPDLSFPVPPDGLPRLYEASWAAR